MALGESRTVGETSTVPCKGDHMTQLDQVPYQCPHLQGVAEGLRDEGISRASMRQEQQVYVEESHVD